jgi:hypothetical protein
LADLSINSEAVSPPPTSVKASKAPEKPSTVVPGLYKATVHVRWMNPRTRVYNDVRGGDVVTFEDGDFGDVRSLISLEDVLERGLFVPFDKALVGKVEAMSRDEMLEMLDRAGKGDELDHNMSAEVLRPLAAAHVLAVQEQEAIARLEGKS